MARPSAGPDSTPLGVLRALAALRRGISLYPSGHVVIDQNATQLEREVTRVIDDYGRFRVEVVGGTAHIDGYPFRLDSQANQEVIGDLLRSGVDCIQIDPGVDRPELVRAAEVMNDLIEGRVSTTGFRDVLAQREIRHITLTRLLPIGARRGGGHEWPQAPQSVENAHYADVLGFAEKSLGPVFESSGSPNVGEIQELLSGVTDLILSGPTALGEILSVKRYENHTYLHSVNVAALSVLLGQRLQLGDQQIRMLAEGALLHDVGKRGVPVEILRKPGPLDQREWRVMQRHPALGAELLASAGGFSPLTPTIALEHHRDFGGGGYPELGDLTPHLMSQIVAVADTYEALTGARTYRDPLRPDEACLILARMAGKKLNPALVRAFVTLITFFPLGTTVRLTTGETGVVVDTCEEEPLHPVVEVRCGGHGRLAVPERIDTALRNEVGDYVRHVAETLGGGERGRTEDAATEPGDDPRVAAAG